MNNKDKIKREKTELEMKVYADIQSEIWNYFVYENIEYNNKTEPEETIAEFFSYLYKLIPLCNRKVHYSKELKNKMKSKLISEDYVHILKKYEKAFNEGKDMNVFLSNNIKKAKSPDLLLFTWQLYHLHLSNKDIAGKNQMKNNRSNMQLLCIIDMNDVYFIDVISHPVKPEEYFNIQHLEVIVKNGWMSKIGFFELKDMVPGTMNINITNNEKLFEIYSKCGLNIAFEFLGKGYAPLLPITEMRKPFNAAGALTEINKQINNFKNKKDTYQQFRLRCSDKDGITGLALFEKPSGKMEFINIFNNITLAMQEKIYK